MALIGSLDDQLEKPLQVIPEAGFVTLGLDYERSRA